MATPMMERPVDGADRSVELVVVAPLDRPEVEDIRAAQRRFGEAIAAFLAEPSTWAFEAVRVEAGDYLDVERRRLLPCLTDAGGDAAEQVTTNHVLLAQAVNTVLWDPPGTFRLCEDVRRLRDALLRQIDTCERELLVGRR